MKEKYGQHMAALVGADTFVADPNNYDEEKLARMMAEYEKAHQRRLAEKEDRLKALDEELSANHAVRTGREMLQSKTMFTPEHRERWQTMNDKIVAQKARMEEHKQAHDQIVGFMKARIDKHNEENEIRVQVVEAQKAAIQADKERAKAERELKNVETRRKKEAYEERRERRRSLSRPRRGN